MIRPILYFLLLLLTANTVMAQRVTDSIAPGKDIYVKKADKYNFQDKDSLGKFLSLVGHARVQQDKILFDADSIVLKR